MDEISLHYVSASWQSYLGISMRVLRIRTDGKQQTDIKRSSDSMDNIEVENILCELEDGITATMAVTTSQTATLDQSAFENFAFNCKEE